MSLSRIRPAGWPTTPTTSDGWLTAADLNALDIDHTNAVDKMNGDTIAGPVVLDGAAGAGWTNNGPTVITGAGSTLKTQNGGRIVIYSNELLVPYWPQYSPARAMFRNQPFLMQRGGGSLIWDVDTNESIAHTGSGQTGNCDITRSLVDGSTLTAIDIYFAVGQAHSGVPAVMPSFSLYAKGLDASTIILLASGSVPSPATGAAWYNSGNQQTYTLIVPSVVVDRTSGSYFVQAIDESGLNALNLNIFRTLRFNYTLSDARPV